MSEPERVCRWQTLGKAAEWWASIGESLAYFPERVSRCRQCYEIQSPHSAITGHIDFCTFDSERL